MSGFIGTKLTMNLGERSYDIILKNGALENLSLIHISEPTRRS